MYTGSIQQHHLHPFISINAVSYTHLDVYKRQGKMLAEPINTFVLTRAAAYQQMNSLYYLEKGTSHHQGEVIAIELMVKPEYITESNGDKNNGK